MSTGAGGLASFFAPKQRKNCSIDISGAISSISPVSASSTPAIKQSPARVAQDNHTPSGNAPVDGSTSTEHPGTSGTASQRTLAFSPPQPQKVSTMEAVVPDAVLATQNGSESPTAPEGESSVPETTATSSTTPASNGSAKTSVLSTPLTGVPVIPAVISTAALEKISPVIAQVLKNAEEAAAAAAIPSAQQAPVRKPLKPLHCPWTEHFTGKGSDRTPYYFNRVTKMSVWEPPAEYERYLVKKAARKRKYGASATAEGYLSKRSRISDEKRAALAAIGLEKAQRKAQAAIQAAAIKAERERIKLEAQKKREEEREQKKLEKEQQLRIQQEEKAKKMEQLAEERRIKHEQREAERVKNREAQEKAKQKRLGVTTGTKMAFSSFFKAVERKKQRQSVQDGQSRVFAAFQKQEDMTLAPISRAQGFTDTRRHKLDLCIQEYDIDDMEDDDDVTLVSDGTTAPPAEALETWVGRWKTARTEAIAAARLRRDEATKKALEQLGDADSDEAAVPMDVDGESADTTNGVHDVYIVDDDAMDNDAATLLRRRQIGVRFKLLQFQEDIRPAYYGSHSKTSAAVTGRRPLHRDTTMDYEYDSGEDWEEEEVGDDCSDAGSDSEGERNDAEEDEDDGFMVAHGYLSDDEGITNGDEGETRTAPSASVADGDKGGAKPPQKRAVARSIGCIFGDAARAHPRLSAFAIVPLSVTPIDVHFEEEACAVQLAEATALEPEVTEIADKPDPPMKQKVAVAKTPITDMFKRMPTKSAGSTQGDGAKTASAANGSTVGDDKPKKPRSVPKIPDDIIPDLIKLVHGSVSNIEKLSADFASMHNTKTSKFAVRGKIFDKSFCVRELREPYKQKRRFVLPEVLKKYNLADLALPDA
eukprot:m.32229 g.32229  ORF g.32229 m.32229 type:complete len:876 (+) comp14092_c0_seq2:117-2744(+)